MGIDKQSDIAANIQIGPTDQGMVRIYIEAEGGIELPLDFDADEAEEIAEELRAAAETARAMSAGRAAGRRETAMASTERLGSAKAPEASEAAASWACCASSPASTMDCGRAAGRRPVFGTAASSGSVSALAGMV